MTEDNVVEFDGVTKLDIPSDRVLKRALEAGIENVVVIGFTPEGEEWFAAASADGGTVLWLLERAKLKLLNVPDTHFEDDGT